MSPGVDTLKEIVLGVCAKSPSILIDVTCRVERCQAASGGCHSDGEDDEANTSLLNFNFRDKVYIPEELSEPLFRRLTSKLPDYAIAFHDVNKCRLRSIDLSALEIPRMLLGPLFYHPLEHICLQGCVVDSAMLHYLKRCRSTLKVLDMANSYGTKSYVDLSELTNLRRLDLSSTSIGKKGKGDLRVLQNLQHVVCLDLSCCSVRDISPLFSLRRSIEWLSLYNCSLLRDGVALAHSLISLTNLVYLDLSKDPIPELDSDHGVSYSLYPSVTYDLLILVSKLPRLKSLDISGTPTLRECDLSPFNPPRQKLSFLGLFKTDACELMDIPADVVTGDANEDQILAAFRAYKNRSSYVLHALRCLYSLAQTDRCVHVSDAIMLIIDVMQAHSRDCRIQIAASASLYYLSKPDEAGCTPTHRRKIVAAILSAMENHRTVSQLQKNCCLTLANFNYANDLGIQYLTVARLLLDAFTEHRDSYLRRIAITIFNAIVCINSCDGKSAIGGIGSIARILSVVKEHILEGQIDYIMETCWSSLWNITDETPRNCELFLDCGGMDLFLKCFTEFANSSGLLRNMMGLLGNVAEVASLRPRLMKFAYLRVFSTLLQSRRFGLEVSYNAAGVISHLASDGEGVWSCDGISRNDLMNEVTDEIQKWDLKSPRNINYRSFKPILRLASCRNVDCAQQWATWALANLTTVYPSKYCKLIKEEDGLWLLSNIVNDPTASSVAQELAQSVLSRVHEELHRGTAV